MSITASFNKDWQLTPWIRGPWPSTSRYRWLRLCDHLNISRAWHDRVPVCTCDVRCFSDIRHGCDGEFAKIQSERWLIVQAGSRNRFINQCKFLSLKLLKMVDHGGRMVSNKWLCLVAEGKLDDYIPRKIKRCGVMSLSTGSISYSWCDNPWFHEMSTDLFQDLFMSNREAKCGILCRLAP